uniref:Phosphomethylpyrimidine synthase n=1 Tax=Ignisphaera aggregans TaxID=334771 RepID=A0A7C4JKW0_9CREN
MLECRAGSIPDEVMFVAKAEDIDASKLARRLSEGRAIIPRNARRSGKIKVIGVGEGLSTKVNVNIGTSGTVADLDMEKQKARIAVEYGADTIMDLSTGGDLQEIRRILMKESEPLPFGTVPTYQAWIEGVKKFNGLPTADWFIKIVEEHLKDGVDFMTIHAAITQDLASKALKSQRIQPVVSRGGAIFTVWMLETGEENPYYSNWDYLLELFAEYDAVISLGDALRPGAIADAHDELQLAELYINAKLVERARSKGVQAMVEGPGHMPLDRIPLDVKLMKSLTRGSPYYVLGPLVTDIAPGYDHIVAAIGAAIAAASGADLICYLTPAEHLSLPNPAQVREGLIAAKIAAHAGDIIKLGHKVVKWDVEMSIHRAELKWDKMFKLAIDGEKAKEVHTQYGVREVTSCTMCGQHCVFILLDKWLKNRPKPSIQDVLFRFAG